MFNFKDIVSVIFPWRANDKRRWDKPRARKTLGLYNKSYKNNQRSYKWWR